MAHSFIKCEAVKVSYRQTKDGMVVAFAVHPNDMPPELALAPVGTRVLLAVAEIVDEPVAEPEKNTDRSEAARERYQMQDKMAKARDRAVMLCKEKRYRDWRGVETELHALTDLYQTLGIESRREIASDERAYQAFLALETSYLQATGRMAEAR